MAAPKPRVGIRFLHASRQVDCYVVRVTKTSVYYRLAGGVGGGNVHVKNWDRLYGGPAPKDR